MEKEKVYSKVILVNSEEDDSPTNTVLEWLNYKGYDTVRINENDFVSLNFISLSNEVDIDFEIVFRSQGALRFSDIHSYWYRRGNVDMHSFKDTHNGLSEFEEGILKQLKNESFYLKRFFHLALNSKFNINSVFDNNYSKLFNLNLAKSVGLSIPNTLITTSRKSVLDFFEQNESVVTKAIGEGVSWYSNESDLNLEGYTAEVGMKEIMGFNNEFYPSLFQENVMKFCELRIFYLHGTFFTSAIFSQNDEQTKVDFRNYNINNPNRVVPFSLPKEIEKKINQFMKLIDLNCGSIDMILSKKLEFVFLEVNPLGQFEQVSYPCNFNIEEVIAELLIYQS